MDKFEKRTICLYCEKEMDAIYRNKKFCSDKCRVYYNRENPVIKLEGVLHTEKGITIINPDNGVIIQEIKPPIRLPKSIKEIEKEYPKEEFPRLKGENSIEYRLRMIEENKK